MAGELIQSWHERARKPIILGKENPQGDLPKKGDIVFINATPPLQFPQIINIVTDNYSGGRDEPLFYTQTADGVPCDGGDAMRANPGSTIYIYRGPIPHNVVVNIAKYFPS